MPEASGLPDRRSTAGTELLRLAVLARLGSGAAHSLNNAFTVMLGELTFLLEDRKEDPDVQEACKLMRSELERCIRLSRGLLAFRQRSNQDVTELEGDLVRAARDVEPLLGETLGSRIELSLDAPDDSLLVPLDQQTLATLVVFLAQTLAGATAGPACLHLRVEGDPRGVELCIDVTCDDGAAGPLEMLLQGAESDGAASRMVNAFRELLAEAGGGMEASRRAGHGVRARLSLPRL